MCEMLGLSSRRKLKVNAELREFFSHAESNPHGWGLAFFLPHGSPLIEKEPVKATASRKLAVRLENPIESAALLAHIRQATIGHLDFVNCHPFVVRDRSGRPWTIVHNGTIFDYPDLGKYSHMQIGETDSERIAYAIADRMDERSTRVGRPLDFDERFDILGGLLADLCTRNNKVNVLVHDGEYLYAHANMRDTLHIRQTEESVWLATAALSPGADWRVLPITQLHAFKDGALVRVGLAHEGEYVFNQRDLDIVYSGYAQL